MGNKNNVVDELSLLKFQVRYENIVWFSYKKSFPEIFNVKQSNKKVTKFTSDTGWGCMIRCC